MKKYTREDFIKKAKEKYGEQYDYSKVNYVDSQTEVTIICKIHGEFRKKPYTFLMGYGCPQCSKLHKWTTDEFIKKAIDIHGNKYGYEKTQYVNKRTKVVITCPIHGDFEQTPHNHISQKQGCPKCGKRYAQEYRKNNYVDYINESKKRFGDIYTFPNIEKLYENSHSKILIKCSRCGNIFEKIACDHLTSEHGGCLHCYSQKSKAEEEIGNKIKELLPYEEIIFRTRSILSKNELDIYIPSKKIAIEYNGIFWHSSAKKDKNYHLQKLEECNNLGINLIQIFEDEFYYHKDIVFSKLSHLLNADNLPKIMGRKCTVSEIKYTEAAVFLEKNHIQGKAKSTIYLGAFHENSLIGVMTFRNENKKNNKWELNRFATDIQYNCIGVGGKLFSYFIKHYNPIEIKSFADRRWTINEDNLYTKLGFKKEKYTLPDYKYVNGNDRKRHHKFGFRKKALNKKYGLPLIMTENEMVNTIKAYKIYDCGLIKYIWKKKE